MSQELTLEPQLEGQQSALVRELKVWKSIQTPAEMENALELCRGAKGIVKQINDFFDPHVRGAHSVWKGLTVARGKLTDKVEAEAKRVQRLIDDYRTAELNKAREIERQREAKERAERLEEQRKQEEAALARACELETEGRGDLAAKVLEQTPAIEIQEAAPVVVAPPKTAGLGTRMVWEYRVTDISKIPVEFLTVNDQLIKATIKHRDIPGIERTERVASSLRA